MRDPEQQNIALECLRLVCGDPDIHPLGVVEVAAKYYAFVTGTEADDSKAKLAAVREMVGWKSDGIG